MNDVKEAFERLLAEPGPPPAGAGEVLAAAHRARGRRRALRVAGAGAAVAVLAVAGAGWLVPADRTAPQPSATAGPSTGPRLSEEAAQVVAQRMRQTLAKALPGGVVGVGAASEWGGDGSSPPDGIATVGASTDVLVGPRRGPLRGGQVLAYLLAGTGPAVGDLCALTPDRRLLDGEEVGCRVLTVRDSQVRVGRMRQTVAEVRDARGYVEYDYAVRYVGGWLVVVWELPYTNEPLNDPTGPGMVAMLDKPVFGPQRLAELTLEPGFAPPA